MRLAPLRCSCLCHGCNQSGLSHNVQELAHRDIAFENLMAQPERELQALADLLDLSGQVMLFATINDTVMSNWQTLV